MYGVVATTPSLPLSSFLWNVFRGQISPLSSRYLKPRINLFEINDHSPLKPFVQVRCNFQDETKTLQFPSEGFATPTLNKSQAESVNRMCSTWAALPNFYQGQNWSVALQEIVNTTLLGTHLADKSIHLSWVDLSRFETRPSLAAAVFFPNCNSSYGTYELATCSIDARWLPNTLKIEPGLDVSVRVSTGSWQAFALSLVGSDTTVLIIIDLNWAAALNAPLPMTGSLKDSKTAVETILSKVFNLKEGNCDGWKDSGISGIEIRVLEAYLGFVVADGLFRVGSESNYSVRYLRESREIYSRNGTLVDWFYDSGLVYEDPNGTTEAEATKWRELTANWSNITLQGFRYGYGWNLDTSTSKIAAAILLFHSLLALIAIAALFAAKAVSTRWTTSGEVLALALRSTSSVNAKSRLKNVGAGMIDWTRGRKLWRRELTKMVTFNSSLWRMLMRWDC